MSRVLESQQWGLPSDGGGRGAGAGGQEDSTWEICKQTNTHSILGSVMGHTCVLSCLVSQPTHELVIHVPFLRWGNRGPAQGSDLPMVRQAASGRSKAR